MIPIEILIIGFINNIENTSTGQSYTELLSIKLNKLNQTNKIKELLLILLNKIYSEEFLTLLQSRQSH
jgi:hypothetical protein